MDIKDIRLKKGMSRNDVNELIREWLLLEDSIYMGSHYKHNWKCKCGNIIEGRSWNTIQYCNNCYSCKQCKYISTEEKYKYEVEKTGEYEYVRSFRKGDITSGGISVGDSPYIQIIHKYCNCICETSYGMFINKKYRCPNCCQLYENSFAHHIEVEVGESLEKYWDFEKNTVNPYFISKSCKFMVWIKCQNEDINELNGLRKKDYHESYEVKCYLFLKNTRCPCCNPKSYKTVHPYDSFGYHHFDKVMSWHPDNEISPFKVARASSKKYKFICETCGHEFGKRIKDITCKESWCPDCNKSKGEKFIKTWLDSNKYEYINDQPYFDDLVSVNLRHLRPDFILPEHKIWIEYDGVYHYEDVNKDGSFNILKKHDKRKNDYAKKHGWKMIRIPYWEFDNIENILNEEIF